MCNFSTIVLLYRPQFGFATDRGTDMAIALAHDVSEHFNRRGSPVFT